MEIRVLRYFVAVARTQNMTQAAKHLHVAQPTLSVQLKRLEEEVGKKLFVRSNYSIKLTTEGILFKKRAEDILSMVDKTLDEFHALDDIYGGEIYLGSAESEGFHVLAKIASKMQEEHPALTFHLYSGNTETITERLDNGLLDFGVIVQNVDLKKYNYIKVPTQDKWGVIMKKDSPLASHETVSIEDIVTLPLIVSRQGMTEDLPKFFKEKTDDLHIIATYDLIYNASILVKEGLGYALTFDKLVDTSKESELCFRPLFPILETNMYIIWKKYQVFSPIAEMMLDNMKSYFE